MFILRPQVDYEDSTLAAILIVNLVCLCFGGCLRNEDTLLSRVFADLY